MFDDYADMLSKCRGEFDGYWGDVLIDRVQECLADFGTQDWQRLASAVDGKPEA